MKWLVWQRTREHSVSLVICYRHQDEFRGHYSILPNMPIVWYFGYKTKTKCVLLDIHWYIVIHTFSEISISHQIKNRRTEYRHIWENDQGIAKIYLEAIFGCFIGKHLKYSFMMKKKDHFGLYSTWISPKSSLCIYITVLRNLILEASILSHSLFVIS